MTDIKRKIYFVQVNSVYGNEVYFPYAAGVLAAYALEDETVRNSFIFEKIIYIREDAGDAAEKMTEPFLVSFSTYVWNFEYSKSLACEIKKRYPECIIIFGGHQVPVGFQLLEEYHYIDILNHGEGEESFCELLKALADDGRIDKVPNISYRTESGPVSTPPAKTVCIDYPSPYLSGIFDSIMEPGGYSFSAILETNRGCPNKCAFCDWGNVKATVRLFPVERVQQEIEWIAKHKIEYCYCADGNFGLFERDEQIVDMVIDAKKKYGYPKKFQATYAKNKSGVVYSINKKLNDAGMSKGATLSFQTMSKIALKNIGRENMPLEEFTSLMAMYNEAQIPAYSELILGLPGENYDSFRNSLDNLLESGQHMSINIFNCEVFVNAPMGNTDYIREHGIKTVRTSIHQYHCKPLEGNIDEYTNIIVSTASISTAMWKMSNMLGVCVRSFHNLGLLQCFAIYLYYERGIRYTDFYEALLKWAQNNPETVAGKAFGWLGKKYDDILEGHGTLTYYDKKFGDLTWPLEEGLFLQVIFKNESFYNEIRDFLSVYDIEEKVFNDLIQYQINIIKRPGAGDVTLTLGFDFASYFAEIYENLYSTLLEGNVKIRIEGVKLPDSWPDFAREIVWFGRKGGRMINNAIKLEQVT
jgi:radical SAM superfamily enzyme YgiQ (UPF0313 family)